jgi:predicted PurR-regulated permease PerM
VPSLSSFLLAGLLISIFRPITRRLKERGIKDGLAALGGVLAAIVVIVIVTLIILGPVLSNANGFLKSLPDAAANAKAGLESIVANLPTASDSVKQALASSMDALVAKASEAVSNVVGWLVSLASGAFSLGLTTFLALIVTFWLLKDGPHVAKATLKVFPNAWRRDVSVIATSFDKSFSGYLVATAINCSIIFVLDGIGFTLVGLPNPWLFAAMDAIVGVIPYVGSILAFVVAVVVGLAVSPAVGIGTGLVQFAVDQIVYSGIGPIVAGKTVVLHPVMVIFAVTVGAAIAGFWGAILALPVAAAIRVIYIYYRDRDDVVESSAIADEPLEN